MSAERWINTGVLGSLDSAGNISGNYVLAKGLQRDLALLKYEGIRVAIPLWAAPDFYLDSTHLDYSHSFSLLPALLTGDRYANQTLVNLIVDFAAESEVKLVIILAYGPDNNDFGTDTWAKTYGQSLTCLRGRRPSCTLRWRPSFSNLSTS